MLGRNSSRLLETGLTARDVFCFMWRSWESTSTTVWGLFSLPLSLSMLLSWLGQQNTTSGSKSAHNFKTIRRDETQQLNEFSEIAHLITTYWAPRVCWAQAQHWRQWCPGATFVSLRSLCTGAGAYNHVSAMVKRFAQKYIITSDDIHWERKYRVQWMGRADLAQGRRRIEKSD